MLVRERPQVLVFDYEGLGPGSEAAVRRLRRVARGTRILVLATRSSQETLERMLRAGAAGLVGKQQTFETLVRAIHAVARGELWANRAAAAQVVEDLTATSRSSTFDVRLTAREREIVQAVGLGVRNRDIGDRLHISEKTVKSHLNSIFRKLQVDNRFAAGLYSIDWRTGIEDVCSVRAIAGAASAPPALDRLLPLPMIEPPPIDPLRSRVVADYIAALVARHPSGGPLVTAIHPADEMYLYELSLGGRGPDAAAVSYFATGEAVCRTVEDAVRWRFGGPDRAPIRLLDFASGHGRTTRFLVRRLPADSITIAEIEPTAVRFQEDAFGVRGVVSTTDPRRFRPRARRRRRRDVRRRPRLLLLQPPSRGPVRAVAREALRAGEPRRHADVQRARDASAPGVRVRRARGDRLPRRQREPPPRRRRVRNHVRLARRSWPPRPTPSPGTTRPCWPSPTGCAASRTSTCCCARLCRPPST